MKSRRNTDYYVSLSKRITFHNGKPYWVKNSKLAGTIANNGYRRIGFTFNNVYKPILAHRLNWFMNFKIMPNQIDHINNNKDDNSIVNLRDVDHSQNMRNRKPRGSSKFIGVYWSIKRELWVSSISISGKSKYLGGFVSELEAHKAYVNASVKHNVNEYIYKGD